MITIKLIEEIYKVATGETEIGHDDTDALAWISSRCHEVLAIEGVEGFRLREQPLTFTGADADSALALLTEPEKAFVEIAKTIGCESVSLTKTGKCKGCGDIISPAKQFCMACLCENNSK